VSSTCMTRMVQLCLICLFAHLSVSCRYCMSYSTNDKHMLYGMHFARGLVIAEGGGVAPVLLMSVHP